MNSMEMKTRPYICPECGEENDVECTDVEWDDDQLRREYYCNKCGTNWDEFFSLEWKGYAHKSIDYDEKGEKMDFNEVNPITED